MGAHDQAWDRMIHNAENGQLLGNERYDEVGAPLVLEAAGDSMLRELYAFTSVNRLCFAQSSIWPFDGLQAGFVEFNPAGSLAPGRYVVYDGRPYGDSVEALVTEDVAEAVAKLVELLGSPQKARADSREGHEPA